MTMPYANSNENNWVPNERLFITIIDARTESHYELIHSRTIPVVYWSGSSNKIIVILDSINKIYYVIRMHKIIIVKKKM